MAYGSVNADLMTTSDGVSSSGLYGMKSRIINGAMVIDQRNAGASITPVSNQYLVDRWCVQVSQASKITAQQNAGSVTPPIGFTNYQGITSSSAYSIGSSDYFAVQQRIEGYNMADLGWGTANAKTVTLSAWVYSSLTGTFGGSIINGGSTYSYPFTYTISSANTWTQINVTIAGPTSGTWLTTNGIGAFVLFGLGVGATLSGTAGAWAGANYLSATGATSVVGTNGATFYITGVQLEKGSTATSFDYRPYSAELAMCQRYYYLHCSGSTKSIGRGGYFTATQVEVNVFYKVNMRTTPTLVATSGTDYYIAYRNGAGDGFNSLTITDASETQAMIYNNTEASGTAGNVAHVVTNNASASVAFNAEL